MSFERAKSPMGVGPLEENMAQMPCGAVEVGRFWHEKMVRT